MGWGCGAADEEDPDVVANGFGLVPVAPAEIVQRVFDRLAHRLVQAISEQAVQPRALIHFVEVRQRLTFVQNAAAVATGNGGAVGVVERSFHKVTGGEQILEPLLILDSDGRTAEVVGDAEGGDVHFALQLDLLVGQVGGVRRAGDEFHASLFHPLANGGSLRVAHLQRLVVESRLAEPFLEAAGGVQQVVRDNGVEHPHAPFVEDAEDGLLFQ